MCCVYDCWIISTDLQQLSDELGKVKESFTTWQSSATLERLANQNYIHNEVKSR
jgi:hypothetical protein